MTVGWCGCGGGILRTIGAVVATATVLGGVGLKGGATLLGATIVDGVGLKG